MLTFYAENEEEKFQEAIRSIFIDPYQKTKHNMRDATTFRFNLTL